MSPPRSLHDQFGGAAGAAYATRPLAHPLGDLYRLLGEEAAADPDMAARMALPDQRGVDVAGLGCAREEPAVTTPPPMPLLPTRSSKRWRRPPRPPPAAAIRLVLTISDAIYRAAQLRTYALAVRGVLAPARALRTAAR